MITLEVIREFARSLPGSEEGTSYGTPAFRVGKRLFLRLHGKENSIVVLLNSVEEQRELISEDPRNFYITDHYENHAAVLVRPAVSRSKFRTIMESAWSRVARKKDLAQRRRASEQGADPSSA